ncbi:MAG: alpha/beta hydrolase [Anaerolineales bacterium]
MEPATQTPPNYIQVGEGAPVLCIHGLAASLYDWNTLLPELARHNYAAYALDLLGHGESAKPASRAYHVDWMYGHFSRWVDSLALAQPPALVGHSLGGYLALRYALEHPARVRALVLVSPFYALAQLPWLLRRTYHRRLINTAIVSRTPEWVFRIVVDVTSMTMGHSAGGAHALDAATRKQTALDYTRTAPGVYNIPNTMDDLTPRLPDVIHPTLLLWGERDSTLAPRSFAAMLTALPNARGQSIPGAGHVPHQSHPAQVNPMVVEFLEGVGHGSIS